MKREKYSYIEANDHRLEYVWLGPSPDQAPTIVFLHLGLGCVAMWEDFPELVAKATGCGVFVYSRAGYGNSDPIKLPRPVTFMHDEALIVLPEVLSKLRIREAILFGHSDGGSIALIYAGNSETGILSGLILEAPHVFVENIGIESIRAAKENYEHGTQRARLERYQGKNVDCAFRGWNDVWLNPEFRSWNIEEFLPRIKVPVLVIQGTDDRYGTLSQVKTIQAACAGPVQTMILENCGHAPHRKQTDRVLERVISFVSDLRNK